MKRYGLIVAVLVVAWLLGACGAAAPATEAERIEVPVEVTRVLEGEPVTETIIVTEEPMTEEYAQDVAEPAPVTGAETEAIPAPEPTPPVDNQFADYGVNPFVETTVDTLSTFALDVDTASYSVARRYVMDGMLPPHEAVRVEEFVNYFEQGYKAPTDSAFSIYADGAPSPFQRDTHLLRFGVQGYEVAEADRKPASLTFVIDVSGSMDQENRLGLVKQSLQLLVDRLRPTDSVAIVVYGDTARVVLSPTNGEDRATILDAIYSLRPEGATNAEAGLRLGYQVANQAFLNGGINRVILASDGVANVGLTGPESLVSVIRGYADSGITLTSVGFGMGNFSDVVMEQLANDGDGTYAYVDTLDEAQKLFVDDMTSTLQTIALDAKVQVEFDPAVVSRYRLIGYENRAVADQDFRNNAVDAGEIGAGHTATALYAVQLIPGASGRIATTRLRWEDPESHEVAEISGEFSTANLAPAFEQTTPRYQLAVTVAHYAEVLRQSSWGTEISLGQLAALAERLATQLGDDKEVSEFATLVRRASTLQGGR